MPLLPAPNDAVATNDGDVDGVKYRIYTPKEASRSGPLPVGIWTHAGGWVIGSIDQDDLLCRIVAENAPSILISVEYSLAPEAKYPTQLNETLSVYKWARQNASSFGGDPEKFWSIGGSAGGGIALQVANKLVQDPNLKGAIKGVAAIVPVTMHYDQVPEELKPKYTAYVENGSGAPIIDKKSMELFFDYAGVDPKDSDTFTALATENHKNYPPVYFAVCERDPLRDDGLIMEELLKKAGVKTKLDFYKDMPHYVRIIPCNHSLTGMDLLTIIVLDLPSNSRGPAVCREHDRRCEVADLADVDRLIYVWHQAIVFGRPRAS